MSSWIFLILAASALFAINDSFRRFLAPQLNPILITGILSLFVAMLSFLWLFITGKGGEYLGSWYRLWPIFFLTSLALLFGTVSQLKAFSTSPPLHVAMPLLVVGLAIISSIIGFLFFKEPFHTQWFFGFMLALAGAVLMVAR